VVLCWIAAIVVLTQNYSEGRGADAVATSGASGSNLIELGVLGLIGMYSVLRLARDDLPVPIRDAAILLSFPALATLSAIWSVLPMVSLAKGAEMIAIGALALLTSALERSTRRHLVSNVLGSLVVLVASLSITGLALGFENTGRATWPGVHTGTAGTLAAVALLTVLSGAVNGLSLTTRWAASGALTAMLVLSNTRSAIAGFLVGCAFLGWSSARRRSPGGRRLVLTASILLLVGTGWFFRDAVVEFAARDENPADLSKLNGRRDLFDFLSAQIAADGRVVQGYGFGATGQVFIEGAYWAGTAHNGFYQAYADLGALGVATLSLSLLAALTVMFRLRPSTCRRTTIALTLLLVVASIASEAIALPTATFCILALVTAWALAERNLNRQWARDRDPRNGVFKPVSNLNKSDGSERLPQETLPSWLGPNSRENPQHPISALDQTELRNP
jgi:hypothetical protein